MTSTPILRKSLFANVYGVYDWYIKRSLRNPPLKVRTEEHGEIIVDSQWVVGNCQTFESTFRFKDSPMILYKIIVDKKTEKESEDWMAEKLSKESL